MMFIFSDIEQTLKITMTVWFLSGTAMQIWKSSIRLHGNQVTRLSDIHCASFNVWVRDLGHQKVPALSPRQFDTWALRKILRIPYTRHVSNAEVRRTTGCSSLSHLVTNRRLRLFGHIARSSPREDHHWALAACIRPVPPDWKWPAGRPSDTWLRAIEADLGPLNFGLATAWRKATTGDEWRHIVDTVTLQRSTLWKKTAMLERDLGIGGAVCLSQARTM